MRMMRKGGEEEEAEEKEEDEKEEGEGEEEKEAEEEMEVEKKGWRCFALTTGSQAAGESFPDSAFTPKASSITTLDLTKRSR